MAANFWRSTHCRRWLFSADNLLRWQKECSGTFKMEELRLVSDYCVFLMRSVGKVLEWRQPVIATAILLHKRFFIRASLNEFDPRLVVPTCLYVAGKVEEMGQIKVTLVINELHRVVKREKLQGEFPKFTAAQVHECEFHLLDKLGCDLVVFHPYRSLLKFFSDAQVADTLLQSAWNFVNDSYRTDVALMYPPHLIALASLYVAYIQDKQAQPTSLDNGDLRKWFDKLNVNLDEVRDIVKRVMNMYEADVNLDSATKQRRRQYLEDRFQKLYGSRYKR